MCTMLVPPVAFSLAFLVTLAAIGAGLTLREFRAARREGRSLLTGRPA